VIRLSASQQSGLAALAIGDPRRSLLPWTENASDSRPVMAQRRLTIRLIDWGRERVLFQRFPAVDRPEDRPLRDVGPLQPFVKRPTGGPTRSTLPSSSASPVLVRPSWIARHGNAGDFGACGSSRAGGSSLNCSTRSHATSLRRVPPDANAKRIARSRHRRADRSRR
jgi:hypothetical protein